MNCLCCGTIMNPEESKCSYCGAVHIVDLDQGDAVQNYANSHRQKIIEKLNNFRLPAYYYKYEQDKFVDPDRPKQIIIGNGKDCLKKVLWSQESFAQYHRAEKMSLTISYDFGGSKKEFDFDIDLPDTDDFWKLGIEIDEKLRLNVYLGDAEKNTVVNGIGLSLV